MTDLRALELFVAVIDSGSITAGAHAVGLSLSAASTRISALEDAHDARLLQRNRRGVTPTAAGEVLAEHARRVLAETDALERRMAGRARGLTHEIRLSVNSSAVDTLTEFLAGSLARFPDISVVLDLADSGTAQQRVSDGAADLAVASYAAWEPALQTRRLWEDSLVVVGHRGRGDAESADPVPLSVVAQRALVGLSGGSPLQRLVDQEISKLGLTPTYRVRLPSLEAVCAVAGTGAGPAVVPHGVVRQRQVSESLIAPLGESWARRDAVLVARDFDALEAPVRQFADALTQYGREVSTA